MIAVMSIRDFFWNGKKITVTHKKGGTSGDVHLENGHSHPGEAADNLQDGFTFVG